MPMAKAQSSGGIEDIASLLNALGPLFGSGKTTKTESSQANPADLGQADELIKAIQSSVSPDNLDQMTSDILTRAKQEFGPAAIASAGAGLRGYNDTTLISMRNEAMARATAAAAAARLDAVNKANSVASNLVAAKIRAGTTTRVQQQTGASPAGKALAYGSLLLKGYNEVKKRLPKDDVQQEDADINGMSQNTDFTNDQSFAATPDSTASADSLDVEGFNSPASPMTNEEIIQQALAQGDSGGGTPSGGGAGGGDFPVITPDTSSTQAILDSQGIQPGTAMPPATLPIPGTGGAESYPMPPAQPVTTTDPSTGMTTLTSDSGDAVDSIPADSTTFSGSDGTESLFGDAGTDTAGSSANLGSETAGEGFNVGPGYVSAGINVVQGNERGAIGNVVGGAVGSYFGGPVGGSIGSAVGGAIAPPVMDDVENFWVDETDNTGIAYSQSDPLGMVTSNNFSVADKIDSTADPFDYALEEGGIAHTETPTDLINDFATDDIIPTDTSGCFLTTAATKGGELDNGRSLEALRDFRKSQMQTPEGHANITYYYAVAPEVVKRISARSDADFIWKQMRERFITPAVVAHESGLSEETNRIYTEGMKWAMKLTGVH